MPLASWNTATAGWMRPSVAAFLLLEDQPINDLLARAEVVDVPDFAGVSFTMPPRKPDWLMPARKPDWTLERER